VPPSSVRQRRVREGSRSRWLRSHSARRAGLQRTSGPSYRSGRAGQTARLALADPVAAAGPPAQIRCRRDRRDRQGRRGHQHHPAGALLGRRRTFAAREAGWSPDRSPATGSMPHQSPPARQPPARQPGAPSPESASPKFARSGPPAQAAEGAWPELPPSPFQPSEFSLFSAFSKLPKLTTAQRSLPRHPSSCLAFLTPHLSRHSGIPGMRRRHHLAHHLLALLNLTTRSSPRRRSPRPVRDAQPA
jgi:hypothetical protein